ncbi:cation:proton antiporter [Candidatus Peregrinibacteria bacterium]|jgi:Kef-type K+ transport system membrane component KefB|nr:cation:proton antiporter [Candidatus Peregrinibacteria bacterium]MBT7702744.1 cation:proton antiporter [Candidatus Peregrinibacteria bacterium]
MMLVLTIITCIGFSYVMMRLAHKIHLPKVIGLLGAGIILGATPLKDLFLIPHLETINHLGDFGFLTLMFLAGFEVSWCLLFKERKDAFALAITASITPLILSTIVLKLVGFSWIAAIAVGICLAITAEATKATVLLEMKKLQTKLGAILMGSGIVEEVFGLILFMVLIYFATGNVMASGLGHLGIAMLLFAAGILAHNFIGRDKHFLKAIEKWILILLIPFFFISMGTNFSFDAISEQWWVIPIVIFIGLFGKITGSLLSKPLVNDLSWKQLYLVGWGMSSRGTVEVAIAFIALELALIPPILYVSIVLNVVVSVLIFPIMMRRMVKQDAKIMDR